MLSSSFALRIERKRRDDPHPLVRLTSCYEDLHTLFFDVEPRAGSVCDTAWALWHGAKALHERPVEPLDVRARSIPPDRGSFWSG